MPYPLRPDHCFTERLTDLVSRQPRDSKDAKKRHASHPSHADTILFLTLISSLSSTSRSVFHPSLYDTLTITNLWTLFSLVISSYFHLAVPRAVKRATKLSSLLRKPSCLRATFIQYSRTLFRIPYFDSHTFPSELEPALHEPELVLQRKVNRLRRRRFWAAGVNDIFAVDQHDKWLRYGLGLHTGIEPFSGRIMWMWVWHSNRNPQLILSYYLDTLDTLGHMPMVTQSDPGSENFGIANAHTTLRQWHDPALQGTLQHRWMRHKKNVMPEITWSQM
ncbi:uncharacterized protein EDB93DRAFT_1255444 [Suillus bovinus]|uniref:uncharacterized protein n=1 Tax=Suillus bovinus TaxID=48563 RepID=UPI001B85CD4C|nr:uncharacterized protein EDB93DRAFT_1255444 [Suillus bovinus]KAG2131596.1 hypothetical protein EDB93DRAFT_1255444 [Suillus bovinus]